MLKWKWRLACNGGVVGGNGSGSHGSVAYHSSHLGYSYRQTNLWLFISRPNTNFTQYVTSLEIQFPAEATSVLGAQMLVVVTNISRSGMRVAAFWQVIQQLIPDPSDPRPILLELDFFLPSSADQLVRVNVHGNPVYTRVGSEDHLLVGLRFEKFVQGEQEYMGYLADHGIR